MALPKLNTQQHTLELPSTGEKVKFRPFLIKEQKILMMAQESENETEIADAVLNIIDSCTEGLEARKQQYLILNMYSYNSELSLWVRLLL